MSSRGQRTQASTTTCNPWIQGQWILQLKLKKELLSMTSPLTEWETAMPLPQLNLGHKSQPGGGFWFWLTDHLLCAKELLRWEQVMHQDDLDLWRWRGCRRGWDGRSITDPSLPSWTHHSCEWAGIIGTHLPMLCQPWRCSHGTGPKHWIAAGLWRGHKEWKSLSSTPLPPHQSIPMLLITCKEQIQKCRHKRSLGPPQLLQMQS